MDIRRRNIGASIKGATGGGSSSSGTYTINLNGQWEKPLLFQTQIQHYMMVYTEA